ncbi:MAG: hypothetical protein COB76_00735, partial [Alphaproteobacteria bacterium]
AGIHTCAKNYDKHSKNLSFVITDGSKKSYNIDKIIDNSHYTPRVDVSKIQSTVGAGDNHMAGWQIAQAGGGNITDHFKTANTLAAQIIQSPLARLDAPTIKKLLSNEISPYPA